jgi:hypothetical protein
LAVALATFEGRGQGEERFAGAGGADERDQANVVVGQGLQGKRLLGIAGGDAVGRHFFDTHELPLGGAVGGQDAFRAIPQNEIFVGQRIGDALDGISRDIAAVFVKQRDRFAGGVGDDSLAGVELVERLDLVGGVVLRREAERFGLHSQVGVFADQHDGARWLAFLQNQGRIQDAMVGRVLKERGLEPAVELAAQDDADRAHVVPQRSAAL